MDFLVVNEDKKVFADDFVNKVLADLNDIKHSFFTIGFRLREAYEHRYYKELGFNSIIECAEALFGFKSSTTYDLMNVAYLFKDKSCPFRLDNKYADFSQSQLVLFSSVKNLPMNFIGLAKPSDSIDKLRKAKKIWNAVCYYKFNFNSIDELIKYDVQNDTPVVAGEVFENKGNEILQIDASPSSDDVAVVDVAAADDVSVVEDNSDVHNEEVIENSGYPENFLLDIEKKTGALMLARGVRAVWDPDDKGLGVRYVSSSLGEMVLCCVLSTLNSNRVALKHYIADIVQELLDGCDYNVMLCGRKQGNSVFAGNVGNRICDAIEKLVTSAEKPEKTRKRN